MSKHSPDDYHPVKRTSFKSHALKVLQEISFGTVSSIVQTPSPRRKIFKTLALVLCLAGFWYQGAVFVNHVFNYPTTVDVKIVRPPEFSVPAYTICDNNGINRRMFCEEYPDRCEIPSDSFCQKYEYYCGKKKTPVPKKEYYSYSHNISLEEMIELNIEMEDFFEYQNYDADGYERKEYITGPFIRKLDVWAPTYLCYSLNERVNSSLLPLKIPRSIFVKPPINRFQFGIRTDEMFVPGTRAGLLFAIHSPFLAVNPFQKGIFMKPGRTYLVYVRMEEEELLPKPYETNCLNYTEIWDKNGRIGPRAQEMCKDECVSDVIAKCFNCSIPEFLYPTNEKMCSPGVDLDPNECPFDINEFLQRCQDKCRDDCRKTKYSYSIQERFTPYFDENGTRIDNIDNVISVEIYIEEEELIVLKHSPKYLTVEVFSTIGGFLGYWLGVSLLDIIDLFEGFFRILRHPFKRKRDNVHSLDPLS